MGRYPHKKHAVILVSILPPPGQPGRQMEGKGGVWDNAFLPRPTSSQGLLMHRRKHEVCLLLSPSWQRECSAQDYIREKTTGEKQKKKKKKKNGGKKKKKKKKKK